MEVGNIKDEIRRLTTTKLGVEPVVEPVLRSWEIKDGSITANRNFNGLTVVIVDDVVEWIKWVKAKGV